MSPKTIGFIGDIHAGSMCGLWPASLLPSKGFTGIRYMLDCWRDLIKHWPRLDLLILMGDLIDGKQRKSEGVGIFSGDLGEQAEAAVDILSPLCAKANVVHRVFGTPYHEGYDSGAMKFLDERLNVSQARQVLDLDFGGKVLNAAHHPASGGVLYMGTAVDKEALWSAVATHSGHVPDARWIVRAHKHTYFLQETPTRTVAITPCWQLPAAWAVKQNYWRYQPTLGGLLMVKDKDHPDGYRFVRRLYDTPRPRVTKWDADAE